MKGDMFVTQIRMSEELHQRVMRIANETGDSLNGTMLHMLLVGAKFFESQLSDADSST